MGMKMTKMTMGGCKRKRSKRAEPSSCTACPCGKSEEGSPPGLLGEALQVGETLLYRLKEDGPEAVGALLRALPPDEKNPARLELLGPGGRIDTAPRDLCRRP
jgi:hypothetical protein